MEKQSFQVVTTDPQYQKLRDKLTDWSIAKGYSQDSKNVIVRPSLKYDTIKQDVIGYWLKTEVILYFFEECNSDKIYELFTNLNFKVLSWDDNYERVSRELEIKNSAVLPYSKYVIEYTFLKSLSCITC